MFLSSSHIVSQLSVTEVPTSLASHTLRLQREEGPVASYPRGLGTRLKCLQGHSKLLGPGPAMDATPLIN